MLTKERGISPEARIKLLGHPSDRTTHVWYYGVDTDLDLRYGKLGKNSYG
jgi:hypothetical protein